MCGPLPKEHDRTKMTSSVYVFLGLILFMFLCEIGMPVRNCFIYLADSDLTNGKL